MSARDAILDAVRRASPSPVSLPESRPMPGERGTERSMVQRFIDAAEATGASVVRSDRGGESVACDALYSGSGRRVSALAANDDGLNSLAPRSFADTEVFTCSAVLGIAENGAVWLPLSRLQNRAALFLATNVIVCLDELTIVRDFHAAYESIVVAGEPFGVFVAGPSKTADIEQSLIVGAHGPKSLTVVLFGNT